MCESRQGEINRKINNPYLTLTFLLTEILSTPYSCGILPTLLTIEWSHKIINWYIKMHGCVQCYNDAYITLKDRTGTQLNPNLPGVILCQMVPSSATWSLDSWWSPSLDRPFLAWCLHLLPWLILFICPSHSDPLLRLDLSLCVLSLPTGIFLYQNLLLDWNWISTLSSANTFLPEYLPCLITLLARYFTFWIPIIAETISSMAPHLATSIPTCITPLPDPTPE